MNGIVEGNKSSVAAAADTVIIADINWETGESEVVEAVDLFSNDSSSRVNYEVGAYETHHPAVVVFLCIVYAVLSLVAFTGNALVIWIILTVRRMRTVINIYILNLSVADCTIAVFCIPFQFQAALLQKWNLPFFMCKLCPFVQHLTINTSIYTLVAVALDRYRGAASCSP